jgi:hypothetical protein
MKPNTILQHRFMGRGLVVLGAGLLLLVIRGAGYAWALGIVSLILAILPEQATSRSVYGLYGIFLWSLFAMQLHQRFGTSGQLGGVFLLYAASTLLVHWMTTLKSLHSWVMAQAIGITLAETFLILLFWPVNFPSQALMITAIGFLGFEIVQHSQSQNFRLRQLAVPLAVVALAITGTAMTANWLEY